MRVVKNYRAGASLDLVHDEESKGQKLACPLMVLWSTSGLGNQYPVEAIWRDYARDVRGRAMSCGHFLAEERSEETAAALIDFFG